METKLVQIPTSTSKTPPETIKIDTPTTVVTMTLPGTVVIVVVIAIAPTITTINPTEKARKDHLVPDPVTAAINVVRIAMTEMMT